MSARVSSFFVFQGPQVLFLLHQVGKLRALRLHQFQQKFFLLQIGGLLLCGAAAASRSAKSDIAASDFMALLQTVVATLCFPTGNLPGRASSRHFSYAGAERPVRPAGRRLAPSWQRDEFSRGEGDSPSFRRTKIGTVPKSRESVPAVLHPSSFILHPFSCPLPVAGGRGFCQNSFPVSLWKRPPKAGSSAGQHSARGE